MLKGCMNSNEEFQVNEWGNLESSYLPFTQRGILRNAFLDYLKDGRYNESLHVYDKIG